MLRGGHTTYLAHHRPVFQQPRSQRTYSPAQQAMKKQRIINELKGLGVTKYGLMRSEVNELPLILHDDEHLKGVVYGRHDDGFAILVATDRRVMFIDKKPFFVKADEVTYDLVGGVSRSKVWLFEIVTLHTRIGDYKIRTMNFVSARHFIDFIEHRCLEHKLKREDFWL
jgi:hypothetical protein